MDLYFEWLMVQVDCPENFRMLFERLHSRIFVWSVHGDANRAQDGLNLRARFIEETGAEATEEIFMHPCSVLEMMIALACRMDDDILFDPDFGDRSIVWFWQMIDNLMLDGMDNEHFDPQNVDGVLNVLLERRYFSNGSGGLFPLKKPNLNQKRVEIWYQMCSWVNENFE